MEPLLTAAEMHEYDRLAMKDFAIPGIVLMENAGRGVATAMEKEFGSLFRKNILIFCGKGNNGGDGFVAARHLLDRRAHVTVVLMGSSSQVSGDAKVNLGVIRRLARKNREQNLDCFEFKSIDQLTRLKKSDIIVDALLGTGFSGEVKPPYDKVIQWMNNARVPVVAVDIPSGINADNGEAAGVAVRARLAVTMGVRKIGLMVGKGFDHAGTIVVQSIGVPDWIVREQHIQTFLIDRTDVRKALPTRPFDAHKHSIGKIFVLAGSRGLTGAAAMVSLAAMRMGAGAVVLGTPKSVYPILAKKLTEVMVEPLEETAEGSLSPAAIRSIEKFLDWADVVVMGPGVSRQVETQQLVRKLVGTPNKPLVLDADGLNALAENIDVLRKKKSGGLILTPHSGELSRLIGKSAGEIERDRVSIARATARKFGVTLVLKGAPTVTATTDGFVFVNSTGNPGMATAGSGDILAGMIAALWAQKLKAAEACYCGVFLHGLAGDLARAEYGERGLLATDILARSVEAVRLVEDKTH